MEAVDNLDQYCRTMLDERLFSNERNLRFHHQQLFDGIDLRNAEVLDIGSGAGLNGFYAACQGARDVVCLDPEANGSTAGLSGKFRRIQMRLGKRNITLEPAMFQSYDAKGRQFDVVLLHNSVNHLDETACVNLLHDASAQRAYREIFAKIAALSRPGAKLICCDCTRYNFFATLGLRNPLMPTIEWEKHQSPEVWAGLLGEAGFKNPKIRWSAFNRFGRPGAALLGNKLMAYFLKSHFTLTMEKAELQPARVIARNSLS